MLKRITTRRYLLTTFITLLFSITAYHIMAADIYVSATGSDKNSGTFSAPFRTIQHALDLAVTGTSIYVRSGIYHERLLWKNSGTGKQPIVLSKYGTEIVYLDGNNSTNNIQSALLEISGKSHIIINGLHIRNNYRNEARGIYIHGTGTDIQVGNCKIYNIGWTSNTSAIPASGNNANPFIIVGDSSASYNTLYISTNEIYHCVTGYSESLTITGNVTGFQVLKNIIHDNTNIGLVIAGHYSWTKAPADVNQARNGTITGNTIYRCVSQLAASAGIYVDGGKDLTIEGNKCYENGVGISLGCENPNNITGNITVRSNFIYNNRNAAIVIGANAPGSRVEFSSIHNNTLYRNYSVGGYGGEIHLQNTNGITLRNNIVQSRSNIAVIALLGYTSTGLSINYNLYYTASANSNAITFDWGGINGQGYSSLAAFQGATGLEMQGRYANPLFVSTTQLNLHISSSSPAINSSDPGYTPATYGRDIDGQTRLQSSWVDIGADETTYSNLAVSAVSSLKTLSAVHENKNSSSITFAVFPNPVSSNFTISFYNTKDETVMIKLCDGLGREIKSPMNEFTPKGFHQFQFRKGMLPAGIYYLRLITTTQQLIKKVVVN